MGKQKNNLLLGSNTEKSSGTGGHTIFGQILISHEQPSEFVS